MDLVSFTDAVSGAIVLGGTVLATLLRCGFADCAQAMRALTAILAARFDADRLRAGLAGQVQDIQAQGLLRAHLRPLGDVAFDDGVGALFGHRSLDALLAAHQRHKARREGAALAAAATLAQAAELAPVFGLAGTLISLGGLPSHGLDRSAAMAAIAMAVHATLYGLIAANLVLAPLARLVERRAGQEESARQALVDWLAQVLAPSCVLPLARVAPAAPRAPLRGAG